MEINTYFDILPSDLIFVIIETIDNMREKDTLHKSLEEFMKLSERNLKCYKEYVERIYNRKLDGLRSYTLSEIKIKVKEEYRDIFSQLIREYKSLFNIDIAKFYGVIFDRVYIIFVIMMSKNKYYYIKYNNSSIPEDVIKLSYNSSKDLYDSLIYDHIMKLYEQNGYELLLHKFRSHKTNRF